MCHWIKASAYLIKCKYYEGYYILLYILYSQCILTCFKVHGLTTHTNTHNHTIFALQGLVYEVCRSLKVLADIKVGGVFSRDPTVPTGIAVVTLVADAALFRVGCVQDVSDAQLLYCSSVLGNGTGGHTHTEAV